MSDDFKPGLEGVIAFESEIAEPDKEGSALRYRGVDIASAPVESLPRVESTIALASTIKGLAAASASHELKAVKGSLGNDSRPTSP